MSLSPQFGGLIPSQVQEVLNSNYLQFNGGGGAGDTNTFAQQYLPEVYEQEVERYGNRTLSGFLRMVGAEMPMTSDQVIWSEQNRLHIAYTGVGVAAGPGAGNDTAVTLPAAQANVVSINDTIVILDPVTGSEAKAIVTDSGAYAASGLGAQVLTVQTFDNVALIAGNGWSVAADKKVFVYGSDYRKGTDTVQGSVAALNQGRISVDPQLTQYSNSPIILRSQYVVSGSDMAQIGWVEVATEDGTSGYLWYLKAESETRLRFEDYLEMSMVEAEFNQVGGAAGVAASPGSEGLFAAIQARGNVQSGFTAAAGLDEFDAILKNLDTQGAIEENMLFLQRQTALDFDDMLASISGGYAGGTAFGLFENSEEMALNLGFSGFRRGSYDFYKTDWKYLNDASTRGAINGINSIEGVLIPAGTSTVYDQILGTNIRRPFLHVRYRASQADDRRMKSWLTGSAGGAFTSTLDAMEVNFLSERCLVTQAANNFVLFKGI
ncbi:MAG: hypothetical protein ACR2M9_00220 [Cyanophyceae cyanobacterium]